MAAGIAAATAVVAQTDVITERKELMKANGRAARLGGQMAKGEEPFTLEKARQVYASFENASVKFGNLFPEDSKTGGNTRALPAVWTENADFKAKLAAWNQDIKQAEADTKDLDTFKVSFGKVTQACGGCHRKYQAPQ
ncbi:MAG: cytochrome c [Methylobacteriaceae bacterium]|nr:cytochrome c [Methylobacteriaceae bacterium]